MLKCFLSYTGSDTSLTNKIELKNGEVIVLGRGPATKIIHPRCSRNQVELKANYRTQTISIKQLGPNNSSLNGELIGIGLDVTASDGDLIDILMDENGSGVSIPYRVHFEGGSSIQQQPNSAGQGIPSSPAQTQKPPPAGLSPNPKPAKIPKMFTDMKKKKSEPPSVPGAVASFLKSAPTSGDDKGSWESIDGGQLLVYSYSIPRGESKPNVAAFDLDGTIITTKSGRVFPRDNNDWKFLKNNTVAKLQSFMSQNSADSRLVIISNQAGLANKLVEIPGFKRKVETILHQIALPCLFFASTGKSKYRKPLPFIYLLMVEKFNDGVEPNRNSSFYCGDAAGRKKDFSSSDRLFAINLELPFKTPEEFFLGGKPEPFTMPEFNPRALVADKSVDNEHVEFPGGQEMIIMVGYPGSGKSEFVRTALIPRAYIHINRDTLKTQAKCISTASKGLDDGQSVVIDNTNPKKSDRAEYIKLAKKYKVGVRCFKMNVGFSHASHNNRFRQLTDDEHASVPAVAFNTYRAQFQEPESTEGFDSIVSINFIPSFKTDEQQELYSKYLLEK